MVIESDLELEIKSGVVEKFEKIFEQKLEIEEGKMKGEPPSFPRFRALKEALRSREFAQEPLQNHEVRALGSYLLDKDRYSESFRDWIRTRRLEWEQKTLPRNAYLLYAFGAKEMKRRGKSANFGS